MTNNEFSAINQAMAVLPESPEEYFRLGELIFRLPQSRYVTDAMGLTASIDQPTGWTMLTRESLTANGVAEYRLYDMGQRDFGLLTIIPKEVPYGRPEVDSVSAYVFGDGEVVKGMRGIIHGRLLPNRLRESVAKEFVEKISPKSLTQAGNKYPLQNTNSLQQIKKFGEAFLAIMGTIDGKT